MEEINNIVQKLDRKAKGKIGLLNCVYRAAMKQIRRSCRSDEEFSMARNRLLDNVCAAMGEEYREFYSDYIRKMDSAQEPGRSNIIET